MSEEVAGVAEANIAGAPFEVVVDPAAADPRFTTAKGAGLYLGNAGYAAPFTILAKDAWGNDLRATSAPQPKFKALAFTPDQGEAVYADVVYSGDDGAFDVAYTAYVQGPHTVAVVMQAAPEVQTITTNFTSRASVAGAGVFYVALAGVATPALRSDCSPAELAAAVGALDASLGPVTVSRAQSFGNDPYTLPGNNYLDDDAAFADKGDDPAAYVYTLTFDGFVGDVPQLEAWSTFGAAGTILAATETEGTWNHIKGAYRDDFFGDKHVLASFGTRGTDGAVREQLTLRLRRG